MENELNPRHLKFTDEQLREDLAAGLKPVEIARRHGVSRAAISQRVKQLNLTTTSAAVAPGESRRFVRHSIDVMEQLSLNVTRANQLMDACDEWLRDAEDPTKYDIGPRGSEITVTYYVESEGGKKREARKEPLDLLLSKLERFAQIAGPTTCAEIGRVEYRHADPRELILKTQQETRQTVGMVIEAMQKVLEAKALEAWREAMLEEIGKESPDCARRIAERVRRSLALGASLDGPGTVLS